MSHFYSRVVSAKYHEIAIRSTPYKTLWYASASGNRLSTPPPLEDADVGVLYVHKTEAQFQAWIKMSDDTWQRVEESHQHPFLKPYVLSFLANGDPRWVTKASLRTYKGRAKKAERERREQTSELTPQFRAAPY